ncbi:MAG TPA: hypothetical protein VF486_04300 [Actinomycetes bacterium]
MNARLDRPPTWTDPALQALLAAAVLAAAVGAVLLLRAAPVSNVGHVTLRVDNQTSLPLTLEAVDRTGSRLPVGSATAKAQTTFSEVVDIGDQWTFVAVYAGQEVHRQSVSRAELRGSGWTITIPADATDQLERAGFQ